MTINQAAKEWLLNNLPTWESPIVQLGEVYLIQRSVKATIRFPSTLTVELTAVLERL